MGYVILVEWYLGGLLDSTLGFIAVMIATSGLIGAASRSLAVASSGAYLMFLYYGVHIDGVNLISNLMYVTLILIVLGIGFKFWKLEAGGE
jgi:hypothetical protein